MLSRLNRITLIFIAVLLSACGGGGGSEVGTNTPPPVNQAPVATIQTSSNIAADVVSGNLETLAGQGLTLNGSSSHDPEGGVLSYKWTIVSTPAFSVAKLTTPNKVDTTFSPDQTGSYVFNLAVTDDKGDSNEKTISLTAVSDHCLSECVTGIFIDEPVTGLNYSCGDVRSVTNEMGLFSCPNHTQVNFYIQAKNGKHRITIGSYFAKYIGNNTGQRQNTLLQITPKDLVDSVSKREVIGTDADGIQVTNILRLLQALDSSGSLVSQGVLNRIVITDEAKKDIDILGKNINTSDFTKNSLFESTLKPFLDKLSKSLPTSIAAIERFNKSLPVLQSGIYEVSPIIISPVDQANNQLYTGMFGETTQSNIKTIEGLLFILDRDAKLIGLGLEWQNNLSLSELNNNNNIQKTLFDKTPQTLRFSSKETVFDAVGKVKPNFKLLTDNNDTIEITQGTMFKGHLLGNDFFYRNVYGLASTEIVDVTTFGKWRRTGSLMVEGTVNISKTRYVSPSLDGSIWKTKDNDTKPIFPLYLRLTFRDKDLARCSETKGCILGAMGIGILENGNIITDLNNNCRAVDGQLNDTDPISPVIEHRLGMITAAFKDITSGSAISPIILVDDWAKNDAVWGKFYGIYIGMQSSITGGYKAQININSVRDKVVTIESQKDDQKAGSGINATWTNYIKFLSALSTKPTEAQTVAVNQAQGDIIKIEVQDCNSFLK